MTETEDIRHGRDEESNQEMRLVSFQLWQNAQWDSAALEGMVR